MQPEIVAFLLFTHRILHGETIYMLYFSMLFSNQKKLYFPLDTLILFVCRGFNILCLFVFSHLHVVVVLKTGPVSENSFGTAARGLSARCGGPERDARAFQPLYNRL